MGCQIWFCKTEPIGWLADEPLYWDTAGFSVLLRRPRILLVSARIGCFRLAVLSAHALTAKASASDRRTWWAELHQAFAMIPCNCIPLVLIDANARLASTAGTSADNAALLRQFLQRHELAHSSCTNPAGQELTTWVSPIGQGVCIDYVLYPRSISEGARSLGPVSDFEGLVDHDHKPVLVEFALRQKVSSAGSRPRLDLQHLRTPQGRISLHCLLRDMPRVPWSAGVDEHLAAINLHIGRGLERICPAVATRARRPTTSDATWFHIRHRRELRRECHQQKIVMRRMLLSDCFQSWRRRRRVSTADTHLQGLYLGFLGLQIRTANRHIAQMAKQDAAAATRHIFQEAKQAGPESLHRLFRGVLRTGRGYKKPNLSPALLQADGTVAPDSLELLGRHFAVAERATPAEAETVCTRPAREACVTLQAVKALSLPSLAHAFGAMATRKASGLSGVPAEVFRFAPGLAADVHTPLVLKMLMRGQSPLLWRGGRVVPIEKPGKCLSVPGGWRSIMLMEAGAKGLGGALRSELLRGFEAIRVEGQGGSRPRAPMQAAMSQVRGFLMELHAKHRSGGVIFVDGQTAFYATIRQGLLGRDADATLPYLGYLASVLFDEEMERDRFVATALAPGLLERCDVQPEVRRLLAASLDTTWFSLGSHGESTFVTHTGTTPGAPLADLAFQYVFATVLARIQARMSEIGCVSFVGHRCDVRVPAPTWMDDLAVPFATAQAQEVIPTASAALREVAVAFREIGISINWGQGKSELLPVFYGPGARSERVKWCAVAGATFPVHLPDDAVISAHITPTYVHLGSLVAISGGDAEDICRRRTLARALQKPLMRLLCNPYLFGAEKTELLLAMPVARFKHGAGLWRLETKKERDAYHAGYIEIIRRAFRPILGCSSRGLSDGDVCDGLGVLSSKELRIAELTRHAAWLWAEDSDSIRELWLTTGAWAREAREAVRQCAQLAPDDDPWAVLARHPACAKAWIRAFVKERRARRRERGANMLPRWRAMEHARQQGWIFCRFSISSGGDLRHECRECGKAFSTAAALASHTSKLHGRRAKATQLAGGSKCEVCGMEFWSTRRLAEHLRKSASCLQVLDAADLDAPETVPQQHRFAWPPAVVSLGPRPFWATLRPPDQVETGVRVSKAICWPVLPDTTRGASSKGLPAFVKSLVEIGHERELSEEDLPLRLLSTPTSLKGLVDCCLFVAKSRPARSAGWTVRGNWAVSVLGDRAVFRPLRAPFCDTLPAEWQECLPP